MFTAAKESLAERKLRDDMALAGLSITEKAVILEAFEFLEMPMPSGEMYDRMRYYLRHNEVLKQADRKLFKYKQEEEAKWDCSNST